MPPERRRYARMHDRQAAQEARTHAQQARAYAELWYLTLLAWEVEHPRVLVSSVRYGAFRPQSAPSDIEMIGSSLPDQPSYLNLPSGQYRETEVGQIISAMMQSGAFETSENGHLLDALRDASQRKPATLLRENGGWQPDAPRHAAWALAVLSLAVALRDIHARQYMAYCRRVMDRPDVAD